MYPVTPDLVKATQAAVIADAERVRQRKAIRAQRRAAADPNRKPSRPRRRLRPGARGAIA